MATQAERRAATRAKLISAARELFARDGYAETHTNDILEYTGLSRGALYHHFANKQELFEAVFVAITDEVIDYAVKHGKRTGSSLESLISACIAWLRAVRKPEAAAILLNQAPQVLGWKCARDLEANSSLLLMTKSLDHAIATGEVQVPSVELAARIINAMLAEAALAVLYGDPATSIAKQEAAIRQFLEGLRSSA